MQARDRARERMREQVRNAQPTAACRGVAVRFERKRGPRDGESAVDYVKRLGIQNEPVPYRELARALDAVVGMQKFMADMNEQNKLRNARLDALELELAELRQRGSIRNE